MTTLQLKEIMQNNREASIRCLPNRAFPYNLLTVADAVEESQVKKDENNTHPGGGISTNNLLNCETFAPSSEGFYRPMNQKDFYLWSATHSDFQKALEHQFSYLTHVYPMNHEYHLPADYQLKYAPFKMNPQSYLLRHNFQDFQYFVVIDFEATCDKERIPHPQEIIEFPSVLVNSMTGQVEDSFQIYVRPTCNQLLTDFCKELTGIQQMQVDKGVLLSDALLMHDRWLEEKGIKHTNFVVVTWSNWDCRVMLESECRFKRIRKPPYFNRWINLKVPFHEMFGGARCNLKEAVQLAGLSWEGRAHCGLDDAKNTARLLAHLMHRGFRFSVTNSLVSQSVHEGTMQQLMNGQAGPTNRPLNWKHQSWPFFRSNQVQVSPIKEQYIYCYCGVKSSKQVVQLPGPKHGSSFFSCGNWTIAGCALCPYFEWAT